MKALIANTVTDTAALEATKAAIARKDDSVTIALRPLQEKACQFDDNAWEMLLAIASEAATELLSMSHSRFPRDEALAAGVVVPLTRFTESMKEAPETWLASNPEGSLVDGPAVAGFLKVLCLLQCNPRLRMELLERCNGRIEKSVESGGMKVVLDTTTSAYTKKPLKPLSKRDLTAQIGRAVSFLGNNPGGFTIH